MGWKSSTQNCVTSATCEADYLALGDAFKEALLKTAALVFVQPELTGIRLDIFGDNEGAKEIADNPRSVSRSKHVDVKLHFIRGLIREGVVWVLHVRTEKQHAHVFRKSYGGRSFCCAAQLQ